MKNKKFKFTVFLVFLTIVYPCFIKCMRSREIFTPAQIRVMEKSNAFKKYLEQENKKFRYFFTGQVSASAMYDTSQYVGLVQDAVVFYPAAQKLDSTGLNIKDKDQSNMFALNASIKSLIAGPDLWKAKVLGRVEFSFIGMTNSTVGITNLSNAYVSLLWKDTEVRFGSFFHPLAMDNVYASPVSGSEGIGYDPIRRSPIIRISHRMDKVAFTLAVAKIYDVVASTRAAMPDVFGLVSLKLNEKYTVGGGLNYHSEVPRLQTNNGYKTTESVNGITAFVFAKLMLLNFLVKTRFTYIENGNNFGIMGSYNVVSRNAVTDERIYTPNRAAAFWTDIVFLSSKKVEPGIFIGYTKNIGASKNIIKSYSVPSSESGEAKDVDVSLININSFIPDVQYMFQMAPRIWMKIKDLIFGLEVDYYRAAFAKSSLQPGWQNDYDCRARIKNAKPASDLKLIFGIVYTF